MMGIDRWCRKQALSTVKDADWFGDRVGLRLSGLVGMGSELFLLTLCSVANQPLLYLFFNLIGMNMLLLMSVVYRRYLLANRPPTS
jgi:hypothetical protein